MKLRKLIAALCIQAISSISVANYNWSVSPWSTTIYGAVSSVTSPSSSYSCSCDTTVNLPENTNGSGNAQSTFGCAPNLSQYPSKPAQCSFAAESDSNDAKNVYAKISCPNGVTPMEVTVYCSNNDGYVTANGNTLTIDNEDSGYNANIEVIQCPTSGQSPPATMQLNRKNCYQESN